MGCGVWLGHAVWQVHATKPSSDQITFLHVSLSLYPSPELEPEPPHFAAKVFWPLLRPVRGEEHQSCGDEQYFTTLRTHAPQVRPQGLHIQEASFQEGKREVQAHI